MPTKLVLIISLQILCVYGDAFQNALKSYQNQFTGKPSLTKRQTTTQCPTYECLASGAVCSSTACTSCSSTYSSCLGNAFGNSTATCACSLAYYACLNAVNPLCNAYLSSAVEQCYIFSPSGCNCGTAPTSVIYPTCYVDSNYCDVGKTNRCLPRQTSGSCSTSTNNQCGDPTAAVFYSGYQYNCQNTTNNGYQCVKEATQYPGDPCTTSSDCIDNIPCTGGVCQGIAAGSNCNDDNACAYGLACDPTSLTCVAAIANGAPCTTNPNGCAEGLTCGYGGANAGKCVPTYSVAAGQLCNPGSSECQLGTYCNNKNQQNAAGVCTANIANNIACYNDTDCNQYGVTCNCNPTVGNNKYCGSPLGNTPASCASLYQTAINCLAAHQCKSAAQNSCGSNFCGKQLNCALNCFYSGYTNYLKAYCFQNTQIPTCSASSMSVIGSLIMAIILVLFL